MRYKEAHPMQNHGMGFLGERLNSQAVFPGDHRPYYSAITFHSSSAARSTVSLTMTTSNSFSAAS